MVFARGAPDSSRTIVVVDDEPSIRKLTSGILEREGYTVHCFDSGESFLVAGVAADTLAIILDMWMPGLSGIDVLRALYGRRSMPPVIVVTGRGDVPLAVEAMKLGASDFLEKPYKPQQLIDAVEKLAVSGLRRRISPAASRQAEAKIAGLTQRQRDVLLGIVQGEANKTIAHRLGISVRTIESYRSQLFDKLGVRSAAGAVKIALLAGLLEEDIAKSAP